MATVSGRGRARRTSPGEGETPEGLGLLLEMGFGEPQALRVLRDCRGDVDEAIINLLSLTPEGTLPQPQDATQGSQPEVAAVQAETPQGPAPAAVNICSVSSCGRTTEATFETCCRACLESSGLQHGPRCDARLSASSNQASARSSRGRGPRSRRSGQPRGPARDFVEDEDEASFEALLKMSELEAKREEEERERKEKSHELLAEVELLRALELSEAYARQAPPVSLTEEVPGGQGVEARSREPRRRPSKLAGGACGNLGEAGHHGTGNDRGSDANSGAGPGRATSPRAGASAAAVARQGITQGLARGRGHAAYAGPLVCPAAHVSGRDAAAALFDGFPASSTQASFGAEETDLGTRAPSKMSTTGSDRPSARSGSLSGTAQGDRRALVSDEKISGKSDIKESMLIGLDDLHGWPNEQPPCAPGRVTSVGPDGQPRPATRTRPRQQNSPGSATALVAAASGLLLAPPKPR